MRILIIAFLLFCSEQEYMVDEFYKQVQLETGTLDEDGDDIDFIFVQTDLTPGRYEIEIADGPGDLYEVKGTDYFIRFRSYFGYAGYGTEGMLIVGSSAWSSKFIRYD